jgi:phosphonate transport system substrate-binding protein
MKLLHSVSLTFAAVATAAALSLSSCGDQPAAANDGATVLRFTAIPDHNSTDLESKYKPVAEYLSEKLGVPVEYVPTADYTASVEMFRNGDVQLAWFGGLSGVQARDAVEGSRAIAQGTVDPTFKSYFVANASAGLERSDDFPLAIAGMSFTFGSQKSTSGRLMPEHNIRVNSGKSPLEFFGKESSFSGSHDKTAKLVEAGTFQVGALNYITYDTMVAEGKLDPEQCKIIWVTPTYADYNWTVHPSVEATYGAGFADKVQAALVSVSDPSLLKAMSREDGMIAASNEDFASIAVLAKDLGFID